MSRDLCLPVIVAALLATSCEPAPQSPQKIEFVEYGQSTEGLKLSSIVSVLANPRAFLGQRLRVQGVLLIEFEGNQLCLDRSSLESFATANCLRLGLGERLGPSEMEKELSRWNGRTVTLEGVVEATTPSDHFPARLSDVTHVFVIASERRL